MCSKFSKIFLGNNPMIVTLNLHSLTAPFICQYSFNKIDLSSQKLVHYDTPRYLFYTVFCDTICRDRKIFCKKKKSLPTYSIILPVC